MSRILVVQLVSLNAVVQAPGQPREDPDGGFEQGSRGVNYRVREEAGEVVATRAPCMFLSR